jgi:hypothetical protein
MNKSAASRSAHGPAREPRVPPAIALLSERSFAGRKMARAGFIAPDGDVRYPSRWLPSAHRNFARQDFRLAPRTANRAAGGGCRASTMSAFSPTRTGRSVLANFSQSGSPAFLRPSVRRSAYARSVSRIASSQAVMEKSGCIRRSSAAATRASLYRPISAVAAASRTSPGRYPAIRADTA